MKKIILILLALSFGIIVVLKTESYAYTISGQEYTFYNQSTSSIGQSDVLDIGDNFIEYQYFNLGTSSIVGGTTTRIVFSNNITTTPLIAFTPGISQNISVKISFYYSNILQIEETSNFRSGFSLSYFETNFTSPSYLNVDLITIRISDIPIGYDEVNAHILMQSAIIVRGNTMIINQTINTPQYNNGWNDAMNSKVTQIWSLWGNIFDTFMSVFNVFSIKLMGDITIGHIALVPLVLGLIGFIYALGGKRGR